MNERIRELWDKAAIASAAFPSGQNNSWETQVNFMEKFAELIVRECYGEVLCQLYDYNPSSNEQFNLGHETGLKLAVTKIKEHFGVEE